MVGRCASRELCDRYRAGAAGRYSKGGSRAVFKGGVRSANPLQYKFLPLQYKSQIYSKTCKYKSNTCKCSPQIHVNAAPDPCFRIVRNCQFRSYTRRTPPTRAEAGSARNMARTTPPLRSPASASRHNSACFPNDNACHHTQDAHQ